MRTKGVLYFGVVGFAAFLAAAAVLTSACQLGGQMVQVDDDDIGGMVTGPNGPEAGVWVIAETTDLPTGFVRIVVTDNRGRYLLPDLPQADYSVWVRGYGLVDSPKVQAAPGRMLDLTAVAAPDARAAAEYYPGGHWFSLLRERHIAQHAQPGPVAQDPEVGHLLGLSPNR
jgi:hypothetical protein